MATFLPPKRAPRGSGITRAVRREWPKHRRHVRSHCCCVRGCEQGPIEVAHIRTAANAGTSLKPADWNCVSLCAEHHAESHRGERTFERKYGLDLAALAEEFARTSTDQEMKEAMRSMESEAA